MLELKYLPVNIDAKKQLELDFLKVIGNFKSISNVYYNKRKHRNRWIVIGNVVDNGILLTKIIIIKK